MNNNRKILDIIKNYLETPKTYGCLLLNGEWGSGKTFFVKNKVIKYIENSKKKYVYISLYGLDDTREINDKIIKSLIPIFKEDNALTNLISGAGYNLFNKYVLEKLNINDKDVRAAMDKINNFSDYIIIFDDLERCEISINKVMGYINELAEHENQKIILVVNEKEINKINYKNNIELKYLTGISAINASPDIKLIDTKDTKEIIGSSKKEYIIKEEILNNIVSKIFLENNYYNVIKEKLIYQTVEYVPSQEEVFSNIVCELIEKEDLKESLLRLSDELLEVFSKNNYFNIRCLIFWLTKLNVLYENLNLGMEEKYKKEILNNIFKSTLKISINLKRDNKTIDLKFSGSNGQLCLIDSTSFLSSDYCYILKSIKQFYDVSFLDASTMNKEIEEYFEYIKEKENIIPNDWMKFEDIDIHRNFMEIIKRLENNEISVNIIVRNIYYFIRIRDINVISEEELRKFIDILKRKIIENNYVVDELDIIPCNDLSEYKRVIEEIKKCSKIVEDNKIKNEIETATSNGRNFIEYINKKNSDGYFTLNKAFLSLIDILKIKDIILKANNEELYEIGRSILGVYNFSNLSDYYKDDVENIEMLISELQLILDNNSIEDNIKKYNINILKKSLEYTIEKIKK